MKRVRFTKVKALLYRTNAHSAISQDNAIVAEEIPKLGLEE